MLIAKSNYVHQPSKTLRHIASVLITSAFLLSGAHAAPQQADLTDHYDGTATDATNKQTPASMELTQRDGRFSGVIRTVFGDFAIISGTVEKNVAVLIFDAGGTSGTLTLTALGNAADGTYSVADDKGKVQFKRISSLPSSVNGKAAFAAPIMILGVYHMSNPGLDATDVFADDVLQPARQQQLEELVNRLAKFKPTKIAVEEQYGETVWQDRYQRYLANNYTLDNNEVQQIGFRLAKKLGLKAIFPVDFKMYFNGLTPSEMDEPSNIASQRAPAANTAAQLSPEEKLLRSSTIVEYLAHLNQPEIVLKGQELYMSALSPTPGEPAIYKNADLLANWYRRNLRIFSNINRITQPNDRVLVIIGAGHLALLQEFASQSPAFTLVSPEDFLKP